MNRGLTRPIAGRIGRRLLLGATCLRCGHFFQGAAFKRRSRRYGEPAYLDLRCASCTWGIKVNGRRAA